MPEVLAEFAHVSGLLNINESKGQTNPEKTNWSFQIRRRNQVERVIAYVVRGYMAALI